MSLTNQQRIFYVIVVICCVLFPTSYLITPRYTWSFMTNLSFVPFEKFAAAPMRGVTNEEDYVFALRKAVSGINLPWWERESISDCSTLTQSDYGEGREFSFNEVSEKLKQFSNFTLRGHCGIRASLQGSRQKIVSYSLYGSNDDYWRGLPEILQDIKTLYPGWLVRLHTDPRDRFDVLCPLLEQHPHLSICDGINLPPPLGDISYLDARLWRCSPFGDEQVERINVRDTDSKILPREVAAVAEWVASEKLFHFMRDHHQHYAHVMAGMFGVWQPPTAVSLFEHIRTTLFHANHHDDQDNLKSVLDLVSETRSIQHASFHCNTLGGSQPFPTRREKGAFVGAPVYRKQHMNASISVPCPVECRPADHQDWEYC